MKNFGGNSGGKINGKINGKFGRKNSKNFPSSTRIGLIACLISFCAIFGLWQLSGENSQENPIFSAPMANGNGNGIFSSNFQQQFRQDSGAQAPQHPIKTRDFMADQIPGKVYELSKRIEIEESTKPIMVKFRRSNKNFSIHFGLSEFTLLLASDPLPLIPIHELSLDLALRAESTRAKLSFALLSFALQVQLCKFSF